MLDPEHGANCCCSCQYLEGMKCHGSSRGVVWDGHGEICPTYEPARKNDLGTPDNPVTLHGGNIARHVAMFDGAESDTPLVDAAEYKVAMQTEKGWVRGFVQSGLARELERELAAMTAERDLLFDGSTERELRAEVERLRELLKGAVVMLDTVAQCSTNGCDDCADGAKDHANRIRAALGER